MMELEVEFEFCAAHRLPYYDGPCFRMHGHNYKLRVTIEGKVDPKNGMIIDFEDLKKVVNEHVLNVVDHQVLNDFMDNPTAENIIVWFWEKLDGKLAGLKELRLWETQQYSVAYRGQK